MADTEFPTQEQIERRMDQIIDGLGYPMIPALPGIVFRRLTLAERGAASRAYSRHLKEDMAAGGRFSEPLLFTELRRRCLEVGIDYDDLMAAEETFTRRVFDKAPAELRDMAPRLSSEELAAMDTEAQEAYLNGLRERTKRIEEFIANLFTPEEKIIRGQIEQVKLLKVQLEAQSYEHLARVHLRMTEILAGARRGDTGATPYFESIEELYDLADTDNTTWMLVAAKWAEFREGRWPGFTRRSSSTP